MSVKVDLNTYQDMFDSLLRQLSQEIGRLSRAGMKESSAHPDGETFIYELNSFYYRSFVEKFCPDYKNAIKEDVSNLLHLSLQEDMVKHNILTNLKRYTKLYNQCKRLAALLEDWRLENAQAQESFSSDLERYGLELFYALKSIQTSLQSLQEMMQGLQSLLEDQQLLDIANHAIIPLDLFDILVGLGSDNRMIMEHFNYLLIELRQLLNTQRKAVLNKETGRSDVAKIATSAIQELSKYIDKADQSMLAFYRRNILEPLSLKAGLLAQYGSSSNLIQFDRTAQDFELYLQSLLFVLEKAFAIAPGPSRHLLRAAKQLARLKPDFSGQIPAKLDELVKETNGVINNFPLVQGADFDYFSGKSNDILNKCQTWLDTLTDHGEFSHIAPLELRLGQLKHELSYFQLRLEILNTQQSQATQTYARLHQIGQMLASYFTLITDIKADLERMLAPRNLSRAWKDLRVKVERVVLDKGRYFPHDYLDLLDKYRVETRISEQPDNIVLYEEGDIFIIRVEDLCEEEVPYLVVSQQKLAADANN
ncbi:MAG: hypothetical protein ABFD18_10395 [Syntrophomonas sp.]